MRFLLFNQLETSCYAFLLNFQLCAFCLNIYISISWIFHRCCWLHFSAVVRANQVTQGNSYIKIRIPLVIFRKEFLKKKPIENGWFNQTSVILTIHFLSNTTRSVGNQLLSFSVGDPAQCHLFTISSQTFSISLGMPVPNSLICFAHRRKFLHQDPVSPSCI